MKLLTKSTYYYLAFSSITIFAGVILLYFAIKKDIYKQIDESLLTEKEIIRDQIEQTNQIPDFEASFGHEIEVRLFEKPFQQVQRFNDTLILDTVSGERYLHRHLHYEGSTPQKQGFIINISQEFSEKIDLLKDIGVYIFLLFVSLFILSILWNYIISRNLWNPFYTTVRKAEKFDIQSDKPLEFPVTNIMEFQQLNSVLNQLTLKMRNDYLSLKEYNENAAHEIQTPLAIIRSKMEILMQKEGLNNDSINLIKSINEATTRLFKLNQGLLLISKIDNLYFKEEKEVSLRKIIEDNISNYDEILQLKNIVIESEATDPAYVRMNEILAEILISNLLSNAVRYNTDRGGYIRYVINDSFLVISNPGIPLKSDPELLFRRFHKESDNPHSVGLGLSIVKKITDAYRMKITYTCTGNIHAVRLDYNKDIASLK